MQNLGIDPRSSLTSMKVNEVEVEAAAWVRRRMHVLFFAQKDGIQHVVHGGAVDPGVTMQHGWRGGYKSGVVCGCW
jgi:hypothetical protein